MEKVGFIGMGNMAEAIAGGFVCSGVIPAQNIYAFDVAQEKLKKTAQTYGFHGCATITEMVSQVDTILVAVKPYLVEQVVSPLKELLKGKVLLSVAAGWDFVRYQSILDDSTRHLFIMPNTPALVGEGVLLLEETNSLTEEEFQQAKNWFGAVGTVKVLPSSLMDIGGTVSSCAPAFLSLVVEAMADGGVMYGLPRQTAYELASQAMAGTGKMILQRALHPGQLKDMVCSPKGSTILGVASLEKNGLRNAMISAIDTVMKR
ncbi:MAG: pyrroline-5-carboxylate reductase [Lachnospiraceae bacterium]|nr:pyrroline-5-carboxylate reductase [Lachnospiraceae bacterium]